MSAFLWRCTKDCQDPNPLSRWWAGHFCTSGAVPSCVRKSMSSTQAGKQPKLGVQMNMLTGHWSMCAGAQSCSKPCRACRTSLARLIRRKPGGASLRRQGAGTSSVHSEASQKHSRAHVDICDIMQRL